MHHHVHRAVLQRLISAQRATELLARLQVFDGNFLQLSHRANGLRAERRATDVQRVFNRVLRLATSAEERIGTDRNVGEFDVGATLRVLHWVRVALHARRVCGHEK